MTEESEGYNIERPLVSVIIPVYNMEEYINDSIKSTLQGELDQIEVIVIDDGSSDKTKKIIERYTKKEKPFYDKRVRYKYQKNSGKSVAVNRGIKMSRGNYIAILDADDELTSHSLSCRYEALEGRESCVSVGGFEVFRRERILGHRKAPQQTSPDNLRRSFWFSYKTPFSLNNCLIPIRLINETGYFDTSLNRCQDIDYAIRMLVNTEKVISVDNIVYRYRKHRTKLIERMKIRMRTMFYRAKVMWRNFSIPINLFIVLYVFFVDTCKALYEIYGVYEK